jgi:hypothetical protein
MKIFSYLKRDGVLFTVLFIAFIVLIFTLYCRYPYYPDPMPNEYQPPPAAQAPGR